MTYQKDSNVSQLGGWIDEGVRDIHVTGISGSARSYLLARLLVAAENPVLVILPTAKHAKGLFREMEFFLPRSQVHGEAGQRRLYDFPVYDISPLTGLSPHKEVVFRRIQSLYTLRTEKNPIVITSVEAMMLRVPPREVMTGAVEYLEAGEEVDREGLLRRLEANGYLRTSLVEEGGDYSVRGGVIDVFPPLHTYPMRLEFWGDSIDSIRHFDPLSQRSREQVREAVILPANEIIMEQENIQRARSMGRIPAPFQESGSFPGQEAWLNHFYDRLETPFDYLPDKGVICLMDTPHIERGADNFAKRFQEDAERYRQDAVESERPFPELKGIVLSPEEINRSLESYQRIEFTELPLGNGGGSCKSLDIRGASGTGEGLDLRTADRGKISMAPLAEKISGWVDMGARVVLVCRTEQQANRLREILENYRVTVDEVVSRWGEVSRGRGLSLCLGRLTKGFSWLDLGLFVISEDQLFGPKRGRARSRRQAGAGDLGWTSFSQLKEGDLVVHQDHGIGQYGGLCKMEIEEKVNDFVIIDYAQSDRLYLPADRISILQKYVGADESNPHLDQLGGRSWKVAKEKAKKSVKEIARQLVEIYALRKYRKGYAFSLPDNFYREFEATFEHEETQDQVKAIDDILEDMGRELPMDRLVCGDVGFGKTELALRAAFKAVTDGKQVAMLVPTTVLAEQHYETFRGRMAPFGIEVGVLSRFKRQAEQKEIIAKVRSGKIDVIIGTHRILQKDMGFRDLGLLIIDEEQRFGVKQKEVLKKYRALVDVLALTATPIPRTLHMSFMGIRDLSIIETPPEDRLAIKTYLTPFDETTIVRAIETEMERGGQVFFVHNRVQTIENMADRLGRLVPRARLAIAHGQMREKDLEDTMMRFLGKEIDVLVCTTIIESGLDIPSANTIFINEADRFGLAQIYQLRGRVGRSEEDAYAYLLLSRGANLSREAEKRLRALMDFSHLGAGMHLAMHDLKIRGGGNMLGFSQSGHISAIGYELYVKLIEQSVAELKGEEWQEDINPEINVNLSAYLPAHYISDGDVRLNLYRRLSSLREESELGSITEELHDRFGAPPLEVSNLLHVVSIRLLLKRVRVSRLDITGEGLTFTFYQDTKVDPEALIRMAEKRPLRYRFLSGDKLKVLKRGQSPLEALGEAREVVGRFVSKMVNSEKPQ